MKFWQLSDTRTYKLISMTPADDSAAQPCASILSTPTEDSIKVKLSKISITSTDVAAYQGKYGRYPIVPARSALAHVSESAIPSYKTGQRVYLSPYHMGANGNYKTRSIDLDGYLADYCHVPTSDIYSLPEGINDDEVTFIEDIALAIKTLETLAVDKAEYIALYGASHVNLIIAQLAMYYQTVPVVIDDEDRLAVAQELGIYYTIDPREEVLAQKVIEITSGKLFDHLIFDSDSFSNIDDLLCEIKLGGKAAVIGYNPHIESLHCDLSTVTSRELKIYGVNNGYGEIPSAINMLANQIVKIKGLVEHRAKADGFPEFMKMLAERKSYGKSIIELN